jgi:hypothetical protein
MTNPAARFRTLARALPGTEERDHLGSPSFRVASKIYAQLANGESAGLVKMALDAQAARVSAEPRRFWLPAHWSRYGWTYVRLGDTAAAEMGELLEVSWSLIAPKRMVRAFRAAACAPGK